jgi:hypothetical protein
MVQVYEKVVMDVLPWPDGQGFSGGSVWWDQLLDKSERQKLDNLLGIALLDEKVRDNLLHSRTDALLNPFGFSDEVRHWLKSIHAASLSELAEAILKGPHLNTAGSSI